jgi:hypothetical protein
MKFQLDRSGSVQQSHPKQPLATDKWGKDTNTTHHNAGLTAGKTSTERPRSRRGVPGVEQQDLASGSWCKICQLAETSFLSIPFGPKAWGFKQHIPSKRREPLTHPSITSQDIDTSIYYGLTVPSVNLIFVWLCIIDTNNIDNQPDATIMVY